MRHLADISIYQEEDEEGLFQIRIQPHGEVDVLTVMDALSWQLAALAHENMELWDDSVTTLIEEVIEDFQEHLNQLSTNGAEFLPEH